MRKQRVLRKPSMLIVTILLCSCPFLTVESAFAKTWTPGVARGDFCCYEAYGVYTCSNPDVKIEVSPFEQNNTDWVRINITDVVGSVVYQLYTLHFKNSSESFLERETNVNPDYRDTLSFSQKGIPLCAADLDPGDPFPTSKFTINDTRIVRSLGAERETVHFSWNLSDDWGDCYLDRKTGVLVEIYRVHKFTNNDTGVTIEKADVVNLTGTNLWTADESLTASQTLTLVILIAIDIALLIAAIAWSIHKKKAEKREKEKLSKLHENHLSSQNHWFPSLAQRRSISCVRLR